MNNTTSSVKNFRFLQNDPGSLEVLSFLIVINSNFMGSQAGVVDINHTSTTNFVCGLSFSRSQPDFEGFFRALRFPPSSKSTPSLIHLAVVLCSEIIHGSCSGVERLAGSTVPFDPTSLSCALRNSVSDCEEGRLAGQILSIKES